MNENILKLVDFIKETRIENQNELLQEQVKKCFLDLVMVTSCGTRNSSSHIFANYAVSLYPGEVATILTTGKKASLLGATIANAVAANALDIDDGYSLTMGHPGAGIIGGIIAVGEVCNSTYGDVLSALLVGYEVSMRQGLTLQNYYNFYHSTGSYAGYGTAAAVGKLMGLPEEILSNALGIADYFGPLVPCMRTVSEPSLNKDGIYMGAKLGVEAVLLAKSGVDGKAHILADYEYKEQMIESLGDKWLIYDLYFKFFSCCRWVQGALSCIRDLKEKFDIDVDKIDHIEVFSYGATGALYDGVPANETEAQYNMRYPIAAYLIHDDFGPVQSSWNIDNSKEIVTLMDKIEFSKNSEFENQFPAKRLTCVQITLNDGQIMTSQPMEPIGEPNSHVTMEQIIEKGLRINSYYNAPEVVRDVIETILSASYKTPFKEILNAIKRIAVY